ncbi:CHAT domain-containing protein [Iningainema tapete]|uniref:CHAT domain-containing protein n=1 Tax=Iningainema tapete BLCC-T55 TaxID=2748662 RepID=A0A8J6XBX0_9CYAN|nr:CHAT domain-containing protein [Iningainema tapete BLCC-T55]
MKKILILSANPKNTDKLRLDEEVREIQTALRQAKNRSEFEIVTELALRVDDLHRALLDHQPTIVHFSGHGAGSHGLVLENNSGQMQLVSTESLARLFGLFQKQIECVFLNACYSEAQAQAIHQHIDYVIGMNQTIGDKAAIKFAIGFYNALGVNKSYEDCFEFGCALIDLQGIPESQTPILKARKRPSVPVKETDPKITTPEEQNSQPKHMGGISQNVSGGYVHGGMQAAQGNNNQQISNTYASQEQKQTLAEAVAEIQQLLEQLSQTYPTDTTLGKMTIATEAIKCFENNPILMQKITSALKDGSIFTFKQLLNHPAADFTITALEDWHKNNLRK